MTEKTTFDLIFGRIWQPFWREKMTDGEQKVLTRGVAAGTLIGLAIGGIIALVIAMKPELFAALVR